MDDPTELHEAASMGNKRLLENLLVQGHYDIDSEDWTFQKKTPLHIAVEKGSLNCVRVLLYHGADPGARTRSGLTPAHLAAECGDVRCLKALISYDAPIDLEDNSGVTPLRLAQIYGHESFSSFLTTTLNLIAENKTFELETCDVGQQTTISKFTEQNSKGHSPK